jgi:hypothetical protein
MTGGSGYPGRPAHAAQSRRRPARRIGWGSASRLVDGENGGHGAGNLDTLLTIAAAPPSEATLDPARLEPILMAFRGAGAGTHARVGAGWSAPPRSRTRPRSPRAAMVKCAAVFLVIGGSGVAAASAGVLPTSVQQIAHDYFGGVGIPAPAVSGTADANPSMTPSAAGSLSPAPGPGEATAGGTAQLMPLCRKISANAQNWRTGLAAADQAALVAAAGEPGHVRQYCATLLTLPSGGAAGESQSAAPSPTLSGEPSPSASPEPTATHGNGHASHSPSPNPHGTGH